MATTTLEFLCERIEHEIQQTADREFRRFKSALVDVIDPSALGQAAQDAIVVIAESARPRILVSVRERVLRRAARALTSES